MVLADPGLGEAQLVGPAQGLKIPAVAVVKTPLRRMRRHREQTVLHGALLARSLEERLKELRKSRTNRENGCLPSCKRWNICSPPLQVATDCRASVGRKDETATLVPAPYQNVASAREGDNRPSCAQHRPRAEEPRGHPPLGLHRNRSRRRGSGPQGLAATLRRPRDVLTPALHTRPMPPIPPH